MQSIRIIMGEPIDDYHARPAVGSSFLKAFLRSPLHAWSAYLDPERKPLDKPAFALGRAWHCAVFEPAQFDGRYVADHGANKITTRARVLSELLAMDEAAAGAEVKRCVGVPDDLKPATKDGRALYAELEASGRRPMPESDLDWIVSELARMHGREVLQAYQLDDVRRMASIARHLPISRVLFDQLADKGRAEASAFDADPATSVPIKIRPDYLVEPCDQFPNGLIVDGKSCRDASADGFGRAVWTYSYGLQAALYTAVAQRVLGTKERPTFLWLAQESAHPFAAQYFAASEGLLAYWDARIAELLPRVAECHRTGVWPGYPTTVETLALPAWAERRIEEELEGDEHEARL